jgi:hypothetical protein
LLAATLVKHVGAATDKGEDSVGGCRNQTGCLRTGIAGLHDLRGGPDQNIPGDGPSVEIDRRDALGFCQRKERIGHQILRIARRQIAWQCAKRVELVTR